MLIVREIVLTIALASLTFAQETTEQPNAACLEFCNTHFSGISFLSTVLSGCQVGCDFIDLSPANCLVECSKAFNTGNSRDGCEVACDWQVQVAAENTNGNVLDEFGKIDSKLSSLNSSLALMSTKIELSKLSEKLDMAVVNLTMETFKVEERLNSKIMEQVAILNSTIAKEESRATSIENKLAIRYNSLATDVSNDRKQNNRVFDKLNSQIQALMSTSATKSDLSRQISGVEAKIIQENRRADTVEKQLSAAIDNITREQLNAVSSLERRLYLNISSRLETQESSLKAADASLAFSFSQQLSSFNSQIASEKGRAELVESRISSAVDSIAREQYYASSSMERRVSTLESIIKAGSAPYSTTRRF